jgi:hypothetical protein
MLVPTLAAAGYVLWIFIILVVLFMVDGSGEP